MADKDSCCPCCESDEVEIIDSAFDGVNANFQWRCKKCKNEWEC